jgi:UDP-N-acetyl-D-glucosamine dehydrogenase
VSYHDPHVERLNVEGLDMNSVPDLEGGLRTSDCVFVVTDHTAYDWERVRRLSRLIVDTRNVTGDATPRRM